MEIQNFISKNMNDPKEVIFGGINLKCAGCMLKCVS